MPVLTDLHYIESHGQQAGTKETLNFRNSHTSLMIEKWKGEIRFTKVEERRLVQARNYHKAANFIASYRMVNLFDSERIEVRIKSGKESFLG